MKKLTTIYIISLFFTSMTQANTFGTTQSEQVLPTNTYSSTLQSGMCLVTPWKCSNDK
ncbi:hypothetical protein [Pseudoalteromonas piscicida]|uniref:hypothetical protein n=1 Tax=Pseudoalteromonas piscicida TaxID=43662 RepID=UPI0027E52024|nr:hypothetical protein [Pseudoalteromonas piscicida]WMO15656.1 hypothetical protein NI376_08800 [Pseudoalteromonas piscicida]